MELIEFPVASEEGEEIGGEHHQTITVAFPLAYLDDHALGVDVGALELTEFGDAHARGIEGGQDHPMLEIAGGQDQRLDLIAIQDDREGLGLLGIREILDHPRAVQGRLGEKAEGTDRLNKRAPGGLLLRNGGLL